jgi:hypothetical protein
LDFFHLIVASTTTLQHLRLQGKIFKFFLRVAINRRIYSYPDGGHNSGARQVALGVQGSSYYFDGQSYILTNINIRKELYDTRIKMIEDEIVPFGFINNGKEETQFIDSGGEVWELSNAHKSDFL